MMTNFILGGVFFIIGVFLSFTGIGACLGVPLIIVGFVLWVVGAVQLRQAAMRELGESIRKGIAEGAREARGSQEILCPKCEAKMPIDAKFCPSCGRPNVPETS